MNIQIAVVFHNYHLLLYLEIYLLAFEFFRHCLIHSRAYGSIIIYLLFTFLTFLIASKKTIIVSECVANEKCLKWISITNS